MTSVIERAGTSELSRGAVATAMSNFSASGLRAKHVSLEDNVDGMLLSDLVAESLNLQSCHDAVITTALLNPPSGANGNRAVTVVKGKVYPSSRIQFRDIRNLATTGDATFYFENSSDIMVQGCTDRLGLAKSVRFGPNVTGKNGQPTSDTDGTILGSQS